MDDFISEGGYPRGTVVDINLFSAVEIASQLKQIQRVPSQFRRKKAHRDVYDPVIVSLGPYHHGKQGCSHAELFKQVSLDAFISGSCGKDKSFFYGKILERIQEIRSCYEEVEYDDQALAWIMLRDACFFIHLMDLNLEISSLWEVRPAFYSHFGGGRVTFIVRDLYLLENQIPFWVIKLLVCLRFNDGEYTWRKLLLQFMNFLIVGHSEALPLADFEQYQPLHFLDAARHFQLVPVKVFTKRNMFNGRQKNRKLYEIESYQFRSITSLKQKGIRLRLSHQFGFTSHALYGQLQLPPVVVSRNFFVLYSNLIAYEMSPTSETDLPITSFINFIKSLIENPNDVKILREEHILFNCLGSDDEIVKLFRNLDTFNMVNTDIFAELKHDVEKHCRSKAKTWIAELSHTYFASPWTTIAMLAAFLLLFSTFLQTFFTIHPHTG